MTMLPFFVIFLVEVIQIGSQGDQSPHAQHIGSQPADDRICQQHTVGSQGKIRLEATVHEFIELRSGLADEPGWIILLIILG